LRLYQSAHFVKSKDWNGARQFIIPLFMVDYWAGVFAVVAIFNAAALHGEFSNDFFIYPILLMPAFVIEALVLGLVMSGM